MLMPTTSRLSFIFLILCAIALPASGGARSDRAEPSMGGQAASGQAATSDSDADSQDELPDDELAPAAVQLDTSNLSPLLQELYQATRETKSKPCWRAWRTSRN